MNDLIAKAATVSTIGVSCAQSGVSELGNRVKNQKHVKSRKFCKICRKPMTVGIKHGVHQIEGKTKDHMSQTNLNKF